MRLRKAEAAAAGRQQGPAAGHGWAAALQVGGEALVVGLEFEWDEVDLITPSPVRQVLLRCGASHYADGLARKICGRADTAINRHQ